MIVFGTRGSELALTQTRAVAAALAARTGIEYRIEVLQTRGDRIVDLPLPSIGGKGLFTAELEEALRGRRIDAAVHSMKDLPVQDPDGLVVAAVTTRAEPSDVLVFDPAWADDRQPVVPLRPGTRVGTSSHRRRSALVALRPDLEFADVRGNVPTRVDKVRRGDYGAVVLAAAGLDRLGLDLGGLRRLSLPPSVGAPAPAQGALAVQCRSDDADLRRLLALLHDPDTARCVEAERELLRLLGGGCSMPLGALVTAGAGGEHRLQAVLFANAAFHPEPGTGVRADLAGPDPRALATELAGRWRPLVGDPLRGMDVVLLRPRDADGDLADALAVAGARVRQVALTRVVDVAPDAGIAQLLHGRVLAFTSARAVHRFCDESVGLPLAEVPTFAVGPATAAAATARGLRTVTAADGAGGGAGLAQRIAGQDLPRGCGVLFPCGQQRHPALEQALDAAGIPVRPLVLYRTERLPDVAVPEADGTILVFTSPSAAAAYAAAPRRGGARHVAIGATTAAALTGAGLACHAVAPAPTPAALIQTLKELCHARCPA